MPSRITKSSSLKKSSSRKASAPKKASSAGNRSMSRQEAGRLGAEARWGRHREANENLYSYGRQKALKAQEGRRKGLEQPRSRSESRPLRASQGRDLAYEDRWGTPRRESLARNRDESAWRSQQSLSPRRSRRDEREDQYRDYSDQSLYGQNQLNREGFEGRWGRETEREENYGYGRQRGGNQRKRSPYQDQDEERSFEEEDYSEKIRQRARNRLGEGRGANRWEINEQENENFEEESYERPSRSNRWDTSNRRNRGYEDFE